MDGGVQENLGIRPLLKRRCKVILACDASCDASYDDEYVFEDLANLVRSTRIRDGITLRPVPGFELERLRPRHASAKPTSQARGEGDTSQESDEEAGSSQAAESHAGSRAHFAIFTIEYPKVKKHLELNRGVLLYFKSSRTDDEPPDVQTYAQLHPEFPHESTADQFYSPEQFESYRQLGIHLVNSVIASGSKSAAPHDDSELQTLLNQLKPGYAKSILHAFRLVGPRDDKNSSAEEVLSRVVS
jgi:hypothetical protein